MDITFEDVTWNQQRVRCHHKKQGYSGLQADTLKFAV